MDAKTELCCLIGRPVEHSLSPLIHNTLAQRMGINMAYSAFCVEDGNVADAVRGAYALGVRGMNVTVPHKRAVMESLADIDPLAAKIGAVNTLVRTEGGYKGYNTDITGLDRELCEAGIEINGNSVIILGAGGASRAITYLCADRGADRIWLLNRTVSRAEELAAEVNSCFGDIVVPMSLRDYDKIPSGKYPVIQTTSAGLYRNDDRMPDDLGDDFFELVSAGVDIIFNPPVTDFMKKCVEHKAPAYNGLKMLLYQGIAAFELWYGVTVEQSLADEVLSLMEKAL